MATVLFINPDPTTQDRATMLGCGWMPKVPPQYASVATAPCVIVSGQGTTTVLPEPTTAQAVADTLAPILAAEQAAAATLATQQANLSTLQGKAQQALTANAAAIAAAKPGTAAAQASAAYDNSILALRECSTLIRILTNALDSTSGT